MSGCCDTFSMCNSVVTSYVYVSKNWRHWQGICVNYCAQILVRIFFACVCLVFFFFALCTQLTVDLSLKSLFGFFFFFYRRNEGPQKLWRNLLQQRDKRRDQARGGPQAFRIFERYAMEHVFNCNLNPWKCIKRTQSLNPRKQVGVVWSVRPSQRFDKSFSLLLRKTDLKQNKTHFALRWNQRCQNFRVWTSRQSRAAATAVWNHGLHQEHGATWNRTVQHHQRVSANIQSYRF